MERPATELADRYQRRFESFNGRLFGKEQRNTGGLQDYELLFLPVQVSEARDYWSHFLLQFMAGIEVKARMERSKIRVGSWNTMREGGGGVQKANQKTPTKEKDANES